MSYFPVRHFTADQGAGERTRFSASGAKKPEICSDSGGGAFLQKSLILIADYEQMCRESAKIARGEDGTLKIGYLRSYSSREIRLALEEFAEKYPRISVQLFYGNHEELFHLLRTEAVNLVLNDQRRTFSEEYVNLVLTTGKMYIELSGRNAMLSSPPSRRRI